MFKKTAANSSNFGYKKGPVKAIHGDTPGPGSYSIQDKIGIKAGTKGVSFGLKLVN